MGKIVCLMGKSSTGKDTIFKKILADETIKLSTIVPYTTRPMREGETEGVEYHFTDEEGFCRLSEDGKVVEDRSYNTFHGLWRYFTVDDGQICLDEKNYIVIGTLEAYGKMCSYFGKDKMVPILIELDDGVRLSRALAREQKQENPKYEEMCRRFLADSVDFSEEKVKEAQITRRFLNDDLERCLSEVTDYIKDELA